MSRYDTTPTKKDLDEARRDLARIAGREPHQNQTLYSVGYLVAAVESLLHADNEHDAGIIRRARAVARIYREARR